MSSYRRRSARTTITVARRAVNHRPLLEPWNWRRLIPCPPTCNRPFHYRSSWGTCERSSLPDQHYHREVPPRLRLHHRRREASVPGHRERGLLARHETRLDLPQGHQGEAASTALAGGSWRGRRPLLQGVAGERLPRRPSARGGDARRQHAGISERVAGHDRGRRDSVAPA